jgi:serine/threonine protein kinase
MSQRYEIREQIGKGGLGAVYKAFDTQLHREVAMKRVLTTEHATGDEVKAAADKLIAEAKTLSSLNHPNIVTVFDVGQDEKGGFVVMELLKGETLDETVARGVLTQGDFIEIVYQTMEALIAAQASAVLHRDLKPTNVMVIWQPSGKFQTKILDFGLAKFSRAPSVQTMDQEDAVMGSIFFMAPEQFERSELDARTDLYQIGCVYYHALTAQYPFRGETGPQVMNSHLQHRVTPLEKLRPDLSPSICQWVMWLINREMENRPASARAALERFPRNPEPPGAQPVLQAILVEDPPAKVTTGVQVVIPTHAAKPPVPKLTTGPAPSSPKPARTAGAVPKKSATGAVPPKKHTGTVRKPGSTGPVDPADDTPKNRKPLFIGIGAALLIAAIAIGWGAAKSAKSGRERARLAELNNEAKPSGAVEDVNLAIRFLESKEATPEEKKQASDVLGKLEGDGVDTAITTSLSAAVSPYVRLKLAQAAGVRNLNEAAPAIMAAFRGASSDSQKSEFLQAVRPLASKETIPTLLDALKDEHSPQIRDQIEEIIIAYYRRLPREASHSSDLLNRVSKASESERRSLYRILGALGSGDVMARLQTIYSSGDKSAQYDGVNALLNWPDRSALPLTEKILTGSTDNPLKIAVSRAYARLSAMPAPLPLAQKIDVWKKGLSLINRPQDAQRIFTSMAEYPGPEIKAALQEFEKHPAFGALAKQAIKQVDDSLKKAPEIPSGGYLVATAALVTGDEGTGAGYHAPTDSLINWRSPGAWFYWHFKVKEAGNYTIAVEQSFPQIATSEFEVIVGEKSFPGKSATTDSATAFVPVSLSGGVALEAGGKVYTLVLRGRGVTQPRMMDIKRVKLTKQ